MILTHESGSQEDQFDEKKWRQKISWDYPFKYEIFDCILISRFVHREVRLSGGHRVWQDCVTHTAEYFLI